MKILIIGSDSFIAQTFIKQELIDNYLGLSRRAVCSNNEIEVQDFFNIEERYFSNIDVVLNFAAIVHQPKIKDSGLYHSVNYELAIINAQKAKKAGVRLFVQMSTIAVYGDNTSINIDSPYMPINEYGKSKLKADIDLLEMQDENFKVAIVRPSMVYGGGKAPGNMMRLIKLADKNIPLPFMDIDNQRDFINVRNLVQYLKIILDKELNGVFLITDHEPVSTERLLQIIYSSLSKRSKIVRMPRLFINLLKKLRPNEYQKLFGTLKIESNFPYLELINKYSVQQGIQEMVDWYLENKKVRN